MFLRITFSVACVLGVLLLGCQNRPAEEPLRSYTGTLRSGHVAIGAETTGWQLMREGQHAPLEVDVSLVRDDAKRLDGQRVTIFGRMTSRDYLERGMTPVLIAERIGPVGQ